jgi:hypothetical protein
LVYRCGSCAEARRHAEKDVGGEALAHFTDNLATNETAELEVRRGFRGQNHHHLNTLMPRSSTFDFGDMHVNISARASDNILERFQKPPLLLVCFVLGAAHTIYLLVKKYLNYRVCLKLG